jgi:hypothetical protein
MAAPESPTNCVAMASEIVSVQAACTVDEALAKLEYYARATEQALEEVAERVVHGRTRFDR